MIRNGRFQSWRQLFTSPRSPKKLENYPNLKLEEISSFLTFRENVTLKILKMFLMTPGGTKPYNSYLWQEVKNDKQLVERPPPRFVYHYIEYNQKIWKTEKVEKSSKCQMGEKISSREHMSDSDTYILLETCIVYQDPHTRQYRKQEAGSQSWQDKSKTPT